MTIVTGLIGPDSATPADPAQQRARHDARLTLAARICAGLAGSTALLALFGYVANLPALIDVHTGLEGMSPLTALGILALSGSTFFAVARRRKAALASAAIAIAAAAATLGARLFDGADTASLRFGEAIFRLPVERVGRMSIATAASLLLVATTFVLRRLPIAADATSGAAFVTSAIALLGYAYGVGDLYALPMFNSMALNTACCLALLATAALLAEPQTGWARVIGSMELGGSSTRRQLAFIGLFVVAGKVLLWATKSAGLGPAVAMALLVIVTGFPLAFLVLQDGKALNALDRERRAHAREQEKLAAEMVERLAHQAEELARESDERARAEAAMYRAQRMEAVGQLTGGIAHDFNNLLMAIRGNLELLQQGLAVDAAERSRYVEHAMRAAEKGAKVTAQLLAFSRSQRLNIRDVELDPVLISARELIGNALGPDIELQMQLDGAGAWVTTDADQLELAILNLAVNSRDAMPTGGRIRIESAVVGDAADGTSPSVVIRVIDTGVGMTPEIVARAVEPFFTTKELGRGTGLGLAQVYGFVQQCGGDLRIVSVPGEGTTIEILLRGARSSPRALTDAPVRDAASMDAARGRKVLVIDDDDGVREVISGALQSAGYDVIAAKDGESGLALLDDANPDAAIIDFLMPGMNGAEVASIAQKRRPGLPIVFVSGYSETVALDRIASAVVLRKPFDIDTLRRTLASVLR